MVRTVLAGLAMHLARSALLMASFMLVLNANPYSTTMLSTHLVVILPHAGKAHTPTPLHIIATRVTYSAWLAINQQSTIAKNAL
jgi:hypothetical protein